MKRKKGKIKVYSSTIAIITAGIISGGLIGKIIFPVEETSNTNNKTEIEIEINDPLSENTESIVEVKEELTKNIPTVTATTDVNIRDKNNEIVGVLPKDSSLDLITTDESDKYKVYYYDKVCTIAKEYAEKSERVALKTPVKDIGYTNSDIEITTLNNETIIEPALESFEIHAEVNNKYLVKTNNDIGYVNKEDIEVLHDKFVIVDISDQKLTLYNNAEKIVETPIVSGKDETPSTTGMFEIYSITRNRDLVGPNYRSYVDVMMSYNGGEGLHDAEYFTNLDGKSHGWRIPSEFGGNTYHVGGSHGCINMPHTQAIEVSNNVNIGTKVLVKK